MASRRNGLKHGLAAEVLVPEEDRAAYQVELARWEKDMGPDDVVEAHLVRRAAVGSVILDRLDGARERSRSDSAREAVRRWESKRQHAARRKAQDLDRDPFGVVSDLEATAFGCDWLIRQWEALEAPLRLGRGWDWLALTRAQKLMGFPEGEPGPDAEPGVRTLWLLAGAVEPRFVPRLPRRPDEAGLPDEPGAARAALRAFIAGQIDRLVGLRDESWEAVEGPERESVILQAAAADVSKEGQLRHRYARDADRSCNAAVRLYLNIRDRRRRHLVFEAKESAASGGVRLRAPVGGGWWREPDSDPAPPGFARVAPIPAVVAADSFAPAPDPMPVSSDRTADDLAPDGVSSGPPMASEPPPEAGPAALSPDRRAASLPSRPGPTTPGAPRRSEPILNADDSGSVRLNPFQNNGLRNGAPVRPAGAPRRTEPLPGPDRPGHLADSRPEVTPTLAPDPAPGREDPAQSRGRCRPGR